MIQVYQLKSAVESLPIAEAGTTIALHFSEPNLEVVYAHDEEFDIDEVDIEGESVDPNDLQTAH
jgi:hypothetical protein